MGKVLGEHTYVLPVIASDAEHMHYQERQLASRVKTDDKLLL